MNRTVPRILGSVRSPAEARILLANSVDIIDLKDPECGALGALPPQTVRKILAVTDGRAMSSATIGDVPAEDCLSLTRRIRETAALGVDYVKVGLFATAVPECFLQVLRAACREDIAIVVVVFAEDHPSLQGLQDLMESGIVGMMIDTRDKTGRRLRQCLADAPLRRFLHACRKAGIMAGFAGSLQMEDLQAEILFEADYLGFRGALCRDQCRGAVIDATRVQALCTVIRRHAPHEAHPVVPDH